MNIVKKIAGNIFAKVILAFIILTFVLFGVSDFLLNSSGFWAAKVGGTTISGSAFNKAFQVDRKILLQSKNDEQTLKYLNSNQFKSEVLERLVNKALIEKMRSEFGFVASKDLILKEVAKNQMFSKGGKFDYELFKRFLAQNGLSDREYIESVSGEIASGAIVQTISMTSPHNARIIADLENFRQEKRVADVVKFSLKDIKSVDHPTDKEVEEFFAIHKSNYVLPESRMVSYVHFSKKDFDKDVVIGEVELRSEYEKSKDQLTRPEKRNFYHIVFDKEEEAKEFISKLDERAAGDKAKQKAEFAKIAKEAYKKDLKAISANGITKKDFIPELADATFALKIDEHSSVLQSPLGFHVFLLNEVVASRPLTFEESKQDLEKSLLAGREERVLQQKIESIEDLALTSSSLKEVVEKSELKEAIKQVRIDKNGKNEKGEVVQEISKLANFTFNVFAAKKGRISKVFSSEDFSNFYLLLVDDVAVQRDRDLTEVKGEVLQDVIKQKRQDSLQSIAAELTKEAKSNPEKALQIAVKQGFKIEKNSSFARFISVDVGNGRKMVYRSKLLDELFVLKVGESTSTISENDEFSFAVLREIKYPSFSDAEFAAALRENVDGFRSEILQVFSSFMMKKYPVRVNESLFQTEE